MAPVRPLPQVTWYVDDVLDAFHQQRSSSRTDIEQAFQPQDAIACRWSSMVSQMPNICQLSDRSKTRHLDVT
jgi:hypothetical protein